MYLKPSFSLLCSDANFLRLHPGCGPPTVFRWQVKLRYQISLSCSDIPSYYTDYILFIEITGISKSNGGFIGNPKFPDHRLLSVAQASALATPLPFSTAMDLSQLDFLIIIVALGWAPSCPAPRLFSAI